MTIKQCLGSIFTIVLMWVVLGIAGPTTTWALPFITTSNMSMQKFVIDGVQNGIVFTSTGNRALLGLGCIPHYELDVSGSVKVLTPVLIGNSGGNIITADPNNIDWSKGGVQRITLTNANIGVTFVSGPINSQYTILAGDTWVANLMLIVYVAANASGSVNTWTGPSSAPIRWANGALPAFVSTTSQSVYPIVFHAVKDVGGSRIQYYGSY